MEIFLLLMKAIASTVMLALLLYHMLGLSVALLDFEKDDKAFFRDQVRDMKEPDEIRPVGVASWQQFSELSEMIQEINADQQASHPASQRVKMLHDLIKMYLPVPSMVSEYESLYGSFSTRAFYADPQYLLISQTSELHSPPPEDI